MKTLLLCGMLHRMYHFVAYVMPENQFITVVVHILTESGWGNLIGKFNGIICSVRLHILVE